MHPAGRHARSPCARGTLARRARPAQIAATLKTELKLTAVSGNAADIDADEDWDADFNEDVLDNESSAHESYAKDVVESEHDVAMADSASDLDEGYDGYVEEHDHAAHGAEEHAHTFAPPTLMRCFQHWLLVMRALLRSLATCAAQSPSTATPKCVSLMQMGESVVWFAFEASQSPHKLEGRIVKLDTTAQVRYTLPGTRRAHIMDVAPGIAAEVQRFLLHTRSEHVKAADQRIPIADSTLTV